MRKRFIVIFGITLLFLTIITGFSGNNRKIEEFIARYSSLTVEKKLLINGVTMDKHDKSYLKLKALNIKSIKSKEVGDVTLHFVKAKIIYEYNPMMHNVVSKEMIYRWMALVIEEDGFGKMLVDEAKSKNKVSITFDRKLLPGSAEEGESVIQ